MAGATAAVVAGLVRTDSDPAAALLPAAGGTAAIALIVGGAVTIAEAKADMHRMELEETRIAIRHELIPIETECNAICKQVDDEVDRVACLRACVSPGLLTPGILACRSGCEAYDVPARERFVCHQRCYDGLPPAPPRSLASSDGPVQTSTASSTRKSVILGMPD